MAKKALKDMSKDELLAEVAHRNKTGGSLQSTAATNKADILAELELDTEAQAPAQEPSNLPKGHIPGLPEIPADTLMQAPTDEMYTDGEYVQKSNGEVFALCIHEPDGYGKTHSLKNQAHTVQVNEGEFDAQFREKRKGE